MTDLLTTDEANHYFDAIMNHVRDRKDLWKSWHGDNHLIADDHQEWKKDCPEFQELINRIESYFQMKTRATRLNWFRAGDDFKPYHHDAAAVKPDKAKTQNITIGLNLGADRVISFEHAKHKTIIDLPLRNGTMYAFMRDVNVVWRHGVPQESGKGEERISVIDWGYTEKVGNEQSDVAAK